MPTATKSTATPTDSTAAAAASIREQFLTGLRQSQQFALEATKGWADLLGKAMPAAPAIPAVPGAPTAADVHDAVAASFSLLQELVSSQQAFVEQLLTTVLPATPPTPSA